MSYTDIKHKIDLLKEQIEQHGKLTPEQLNKINYKFRLEWNYNSNSMEGNTLTIEETRSVMVGNIVVDKKPYKDVAEMKGHDDVVTDILKIGKGELRLSETRIRKIHEDIIYEEDETKREQVGKWKKTNNYIYNYKGERYDFIDYEEVPEKMHDLLNRTNAAIDAIHHKKKNAPHPLDVAFNFHLEYVNIHPFYDGNGRTARILSNLILISLGYPPFWITVKERDVYYNYLADIQNHWGSPDLLKEFLAEQILHSQELILHVIEGKDIEDEDDLDKEIDLWKRQFVKKDSLEIKSNSIITELYKSSFRPLFIAFLEKASRFDDQFNSKRVINDVEARKSQSIESNNVQHFDDVIEAESNYLKISKEDINIYEIESVGTINSLRIYLYYNGFKNDGINTFSARAELYIGFDEYKYFVSNNGQRLQEKSSITKLYSEELTQDEINSIVKDTVSKLFEEIKSSIK
ncbi:Fic family protein [Flavobacterium zepuense]|uniref:Fic family protein n=1 Tax=Flavobacterium zepuense TaxID=2593302 RepID=A0A552UVM7_9FLAO|nr:Fic family protein [Flavobacterium zepuense]TRW22301.1 Fic family protein [Flavobacterium zepuense]